MFVLPLVFLSCDKCDKSDCDCLKTSENGFAFLPETNLQKQGFSRNEIDTIVVNKYTKGTVQLLSSTTYLLNPLRSQITGNSLSTYFRYLRQPEGWPFDAIYINADNPKNNGEAFYNYDYLIRVGSVKDFRITSIEIEGHQEDTECCNCYKNDRKTIIINNKPYDFSGLYSSESTIYLTK